MSVILFAREKGTYALLLFGDAIEAIRSPAIASPEGTASTTNRTRRPGLVRMVETLGREFVRRGMHAHAAKLRIYYLALRRGLATPGTREVQVHWSEALVVEWFKLLRIPPHEKAYPVRSAQSHCSRCGDRPTNEGGGFQTEKTFPGGWKVRCSNCGEAWLVLEKKADR